ncbi:uncharacterized protein [Miscanthus floridulus]
MKAFGRCTRLLVSLIRPAAVAAAPAAAAIAPAQPQQSTFEEDSMTEEGFLLVNIWNTGSLKQCSRNLIACFKKINHPIQFEAAHSPNGSSCSSPTQFEYTYRDDLVHKNNNDQCQPFKSLFLLDQGDIYPIDSGKLLQLEDMIHKQSVKPGSQQLLYDLFKENSNVVDSFLCGFFNSVGLSIDAWTCMVDCESAKRCVMNFKVMAGLLCLMKSELDEVECVSFDQDLKDCYFALCARRPIQNLIDAADSVSKRKWSASDIYPMLILYEAIADVLGAISDPNVSSRIFQQMQVNFEGIFDRIKIFIGANLNGSCEITHDRHPMTNFLIHSMELFANHNSIVWCIFVADATSSLGDLVLEVIRYWADELKRHSDSYDEGKKYIFLLNNLTRFTWETKKPLQVLVLNSEYGKIIEFLESLINKYTAEYLGKCWGPVRKCVELSSVRKPCLSSLGEFISQFEAIINCQGTWVLETNLKNKLREEIKNYITPCYRTFLQELRKKQLLRPILLIRKHCPGQQGKYMTTEQLDNHVDSLFESGT